MEKKKIIGTDFDGIITDTDPVFREYIKRVTGKQFYREQITKYFYEECLPITKDDVEKAYQLMLKENVWSRMELVDGAKDTLMELAEKFDIVVITARPADARRQSEEFLKRKGIPFKEIHFIKEGNNKINLIKEFPFKFEAFIEDRLDFARGIALSGIKTYMLDYPWNRCLGETANLYRVSSWKEIRESLSAALS
ncbi:MAG: hypothetical protein CVU78_00160 [Elusimicrobia bacterium HGW-Elusimicrobia-2]|nr:MAG: hypothetical protein CVU78_00160 [Elusimicrobia bacterium HGW-Elusimicrobia-2]